MHRHLLAWTVLAALWIVLVRAHHPTLLINVLATGLLVGSYAAAVYVNQLLLIPRLLRRRRRWSYGGALLLVLVAVTLAAVVSIQLVYDLLWGPDPLRNGFWFNFTADFAGAVVHVAGAAALFWFFARRNATVEPGGA